MTLRNWIQFVSLLGIIGWLSVSGFAQDKNTSDPVLVGAGDIATCGQLEGAEATAKLIDKIPGTVFAVGDLAYPDGSEEQFAKCYGPTWGRFKDRTRPAVGNHEYHSDGASAYANYFGAAAGDPKKGYYSYELGAWHIIVLNSECDRWAGVTPILRRGNGCSRIWPRLPPSASWPTGTSRYSARAASMATIR